MLIDTHAHLNFSAFKGDADETVKRALDNDIWMINVGSQYSTSQRAVLMAEKYKEGVYAAVGIHPLHLQKINFSYKDDNELEEVEIKTNGEDFEYSKYLELAKNSKVVAIGEMGLDYHHFEEGDDREELKKKQKEVLIQGIKLANEVEKPIMIHCWDAYEDLYEILKDNPAVRRGIIHSFVGGHKTALKFVELGYKIGLNGIITYSESYDRLIKEIDLKNMLLETDCPYLAPVPRKGERNESMYVKYVAEKIAEIKRVNIEKVEKSTTENARRLLGI
ncbi:MAG: TatD family hydrolase [Parcubacteria group bacterium]|jgi:TatD DNase family protein